MTPSTVAKRSQGLTPSSQLKLIVVSVTLIILEHSKYGVTYWGRRRGKTVHAGFQMDKVTLGQDFFFANTLIFSVNSQSISAPYPIPYGTGAVLFIHL